MKSFSSIVVNMILGGSILSIDLDTLQPTNPMDVTWPFVSGAFEIDVDGAVLIGKGGYGRVYRLRNGQILKLIAFDGSSENAGVYRLCKETLPIPASTPLLELYRDYTEEENHELDFIQQVRLEAEFQSIAYRNIKAMDDSPITAAIYGSGVVQADKLYGIIVMEEVKGIPMKKEIYPTLSRQAFSSIIKQWIRILYELHSLGFSHNDMLLENIILTEGEHPVVKVIDWGISCINIMAPFWNAIRKGFEFRIPDLIQAQIRQEQGYIERDEPLKGPYVLDPATYREIGNIQLYLDKPKQFGVKKRKTHMKKKTRHLKKKRNFLSIKK